MTVDMNRFFQIFFDEADELLAEMERLLLVIAVESPETEDLHAVFRAAHSIKGGAATFGLSDLSDVTHVLESLLDRIRNGDMMLTREHVDAFLSAKDVLKMQLDGHRHGAAVDRHAVADIRMLLQSMLPDASGTIVATSAVSQKASRQEASPDRLFRIRLPGLAERDIEALVAELGLLGTVNRGRPGSDQQTIELRCRESQEEVIAICSFIADPEMISVEELPCPQHETPDEVRTRELAQGYGFFEPIASTGAAPSTAQLSTPAGCLPGTQSLSRTSASAQPAASQPTPTARTSGSRDGDKNGHSAESSSIRVSIEKVDQLINLVGELVITQAMIEQRTGTLDPIRHEKLLNSVNQLTRNTRDLQEAVMSIRMMPMDYVFSRFPRMVRDLAGKLGKKVDFVTHGAATELDKGLIERIVDPLTHLVRNSIDHGIEMPAARVAAGKSEVGRLSISAAHQGGNILIEVSDDGGGLNRERILGKAQERGISVSDGMSDAEVWQLIFAPGFSTADQVTDVSGRGVGMDVVKRNITAMGGAVDIRSSRGFGTTISISLPLTLAILDGMSVRVGDEIYILPLGYVVESLQPARDDVKDISGQGRVVKVRGEYLPLIELHHVFAIEPSYRHPSDGIVVILESEGRKAAALIDELVGQQQIVVKNLESNYRKVTGISGATILGDGGVSLIVDVASLLRSSASRSEEISVLD